MSPASTTQILTATRRWLRPVVYVLLRCGITWQLFSDVAKATYVEVATTRFGKRGRLTNVSRTAMLTGLTRRDVRSQRERAESGAPTESPYVSKASRVLSTWHQEPEFQDAKGKPARLRMAGDGPTFVELLRHCGAGDVRPTTVLRELLSAGAIRKARDGQLEVLQRNYIPQPTDEQLIRLWGTVLADVATVYVHNMTRDSKTPARFERAAKNDRIPVSVAPEFHAFLEREGQRFLERMDAWLTEHELPQGANEATTPVTRMGAGVYQVQD